MNAIRTSGPRLAAAICCLALFGCAATPPGGAGEHRPAAAEQALLAAGTQPSGPARAPELQADGFFFAEGQAWGSSLDAIPRRQRFIPDDRGGPLAGFGAIPERPPRS